METGSRSSCKQILITLQNDTQKDPRSKEERGKDVHLRKVLPKW
jgi:hypothetical protein